MKYHVFVDFDGTVTALDVGYTFFKKFAFGEAEDIVKKYRNGEISAVECLQKECDIYNENPASIDEVNKFIDSQKLTDGFKQFVEFCRVNKIKLTILSAGFDFYINRILKNNNIEHLNVYTTPTSFKNGRIHPDFIYYDKDLCSECANCKGLRIRQLICPETTSVFIGDGHSDNHGALEADIVFAKSFLADYLDRINRNYYFYEDFFGVIKRFDKLIAAD